jgi:hypothetical protein
MFAGFTSRCVMRRNRPRLALPSSKLVVDGLNADLVDLQANLLDELLAAFGPDVRLQIR